MRVLIKGSGDLASGIALRLFNSGFQVIITDSEPSTPVNAKAVFAEAIVKGWAKVENALGILANDPSEAEGVLAQGCIPVLPDPDCRYLEEIGPDVLVDTLPEVKLHVALNDDVPLIIGIGPGFRAESDCHYVIGSQRGHTLGRVISEGMDIPECADTTQETNTTKSPKNIVGLDSAKESGFLEDAALRVSLESLAVAGGVLEAIFRNFKTP